MRYFSILLFAFLFYAVSFSQTTDIFGIINSYAEVLEIDYCANSVSVPSGQGGQFSIQQKVMIIQMRGAITDQSESTDNGKVVNIRGAGNYEINEIKSINSGASDFIEFAYNLEREYNSNSAIQIVSFPSYNDVNITGTLSAVPWDGTRGGILAFEAQGNVNMQANINIDGRGFLGGLGDLSFDDLCYDGLGYLGYGCLSTDECGALRGEGIDVFLGERGRGRNANGGGGGNDHNCGGGGGGNYGNGGHGGINSQGFCISGLPGFGGENTDRSPSIQKILGGGGGGAGDQNDIVFIAEDGGNAGGTAIIRANSITSNGFFITANGNDVVGTTDGDGAGGGGAGGTVVLDISTFNDALDIFLNGGKGGNTGSIDRCPGPGGGGGGGTVWVQGNSIPANINLEATGGSSGSVVSGPCAGSVNLAESGEDGGIQTGFLWYESSHVPFIALDVIAHSDMILCLGDVASLTSEIQSSRPYTISWSTNDTTPEISISPEFSTTFEIEVTDEMGCLVSSEAFISVRNPSIQITADPSGPVFEGDSVSLTTSISPSNNQYTYQWDGGTQPISPADESNAIANPEETALYCLTVTDEIPCSKEECILVEVILPRVIAPDAFSPNGDGLNDEMVFLPSVILNLTALRVYNRWGDLLYESLNRFSWDGTSEGKAQPQDTYTWTIEADQINTGEKLVQTGTILLVR